MCLWLLWWLWSFDDEFMVNIMSMVLCMLRHESSISQNYMLNDVKDIKLTMYVLHHMHEIHGDNYILFRYAVTELPFGSGVYGTTWSGYTY